MKRTLIGLLAIGVAAAVAAAPAWGQDEKVEFVLNAQAITFYGGEESFSGLALGAGLQLDIHVTKGFMVSPEFLFVTDTRLSGVAGLPGVTLNYLGRGFFIGAGVALPMSISGGIYAGELLPKIQIGYRGRKASLSVYTITTINGLFSFGLVGGSIGYRF